jgi:hypothetical protein
MTTTTLSATQLTRIHLVTAPGLPKLPHIPENWDIKLSPQQQEENLLHVALWIVERDLENFDMDNWAGFAQVMAQVKGFTIAPEIAGYCLLGIEAHSHFMDSDGEGLAFLKEVIARNS